MKVLFKQEEKGENEAEEKEEAAKRAAEERLANSAGGVGTDLAEERARLQYQQPMPAHSEPS